MPTNGTNITSIVKSDVGQTAGPDWATNLNTSLDAIDEHDHSTGKGSQITPAGLNINSDLEINSNDVTEVRTVAFSNTTDDSTSDQRAVYTTSGDLYYRNASGQEIQITSGSSISSGGGAITGMSGTSASASFSDANDWFSWQHNSSAGYFAKMLLSDVRLYKFNDSTNYVLLQYNTAATGGTITVPNETGQMLTTNTSSSSDINLETTGTGDINLTCPTGRSVTVTIGAATMTLTDSGSEMSLSLS